MLLLSISADWEHLRILKCSNTPTTPKTMLSANTNHQKVASILFSPQSNWRYGHQKKLRAGFPNQCNKAELQLYQPHSKWSIRCKRNFDFIKWGVTKRTAPVSKFTDLGRINAPNYSDKYKDDFKFGKKEALCNTVCEIQRSYGTEKFFRKFK